MKYILIAIITINFATTRVYNVVDGFLYPCNKDSTCWQWNGEERLVGKYGFSLQGGYDNKPIILTAGIQTASIDSNNKWTFLIKREKIRFMPVDNIKRIPIGKSVYNCNWTNLDPLSKSYRSLKGEIITVQTKHKSSVKFYLK